MPGIRPLAKILSRLPVPVFNRICATAALLWLLGTVPLGLIVRPTFSDFAQFYMGGVIARNGAWHALYPVPRPGSLDNPGLTQHSRAKPEWNRLRREHGVPDQTRFILPPPSALVFVPLTLTDYPSAYWFWISLLTASVWGVGRVAGHLHRAISGQATRTEGLLMLLIAFSPMTARAIRIANVSPPIALLLGLAAWALVRRERPMRAAASILVGALLKYATLVLSPLLLAMRQWRMIAYLAALGISLLATSVAITGLDPFREFQGVIAPTLSRPSTFPGNQSLPGMLARVFGRPFPPSLALLLNGARLVTFAAVLGLLLAVRPRSWREPVNVCAALALLLGWLLIFSPIAWEHWPIFLCPAWGWLLWEAREPGPRRVTALAALALMYVPAGILHVEGFFTLPILVPEPLNSTQLIAMTALCGLAAWRLMRSAITRDDPPRHRHLKYALFTQAAEKLFINRKTRV